MGFTVVKFAVALLYDRACGDRGSGLENRIERDTGVRITMIHVRKARSCAASRHTEAQKGLVGDGLRVVVVRDTVARRT